MYKLLDGITGSTAGDAIQLVEAGVDRDWSVHLTGITGGSITIELGPTKDGPWAPLTFDQNTVAELTVSGVWTSSASRLWYVRANPDTVTGATTVGIK